MDVRATERLAIRVMAANITFEALDEQDLPVLALGCCLSGLGEGAGGEEPFFVVVKSLESLPYGRLVAHTRPAALTELYSRLQFDADLRVPSPESPANTSQERRLASANSDDSDDGAEGRADKQVAKRTLKTKQVFKVGLSASLKLDLDMRAHLTVGANTIFASYTIGWTVEAQIDFQARLPILNLIQHIPILIFKASHVSPRCRTQASGSGNGTTEEGGVPRKRLPRKFSLIKKEGEGLEDDQILP